MKSIIIMSWLPLLGVLCLTAFSVQGFVLPSSTQQRAILSSSSSIAGSTTSTVLFAQQQQQQQRKKNGPKNNNNTNKPKKMTIAELSRQLMKDPKNFPDGQAPTKNNKKKKPRRSRRRSENPQQTYLYAAQRKAAKNLNTHVEGNGGFGDEGDTEEAEDAEAIAAAALEAKQHPVTQARELGLANAANQHCEALVDDEKPEIMGQIRVGEENGSGAYAYIIYKPAGWSILGGAGGGAGGKKKQEKAAATASSTNAKSNTRRVKITSDSGGRADILEFNEDDILSLLSPEERAEIEAEGGPLVDLSGWAHDDTDDIDDLSSSASYAIPGWDDVANMSPEEREEACIEDEDFDPSDIPDFNEADILALLSKEELAEYQQDTKEQLDSVKAAKRKRKEEKRNPLLRYRNMKESGDLDVSAEENIKRIEKRLTENKNSKASFASYARPSVVSWLKDMKAAEGTPVRGGKFWTAVAGATEVDDSGLVLLSPKKKVENVFVEYAEYMAVVGNGQFLTPPKLQKGPDIKKVEAEIDMSIVSRVRKGREGDTCQIVRFAIPDVMSTCSNIVGQAQAQFDDGIRGDPAANPLDRRAPRRLIHCNTLSASSLLFDEDAQAECDSLPDDIAILSDRLNNHKYTLGSFLGRSALGENSLTNAYREINGAADGFPGWTVDRYDKWLFVQHDEKEYKGPLPSIHDGKTTGVYYLPANPDRGAMGANQKVRPTLLEGSAAPETIPILENGVTYHVSVDKDLSTGIFLDQRPHRAWLSRNCNEDTHVLNCFAHCGAFSVAAASAGASTVSLDLNKKWLDRVQPQLEANGIEFNERHDCIYGDCFEWLEKLAKRGEKFDIVILDPPSSSVGKKKRRWSVRNDMDELVALAAPLVKEGGLLWTTTNSAAVPPIKFARLCKKGLDTAGLKSAKLERIQPMPVDFPAIGPNPVKNLVWRI